MARWDPGAEDRLRRAALDLYLERGFEHVSVAEVAERAGLTRRTFFRYFTDKREVLFAGAERLPAAITEAVRDVEPDLDLLETAVAALRVVGLRLVAVIEPQQSRARRAIIAASPELQERERTKLAACTTALADALGERGGTAAPLVARVAVAVFESALARWAGDDGPVDFERCFDEAVSEIAIQFGRLAPAP